MSSQTKKKVKTEKPLTLSQFNKNLKKFHLEVVRPDIKAITSSQLIIFYNDIVEPSIRRIVDEVVEPKIQALRREMNQRFDDLYKKFEDLRQEYIIAYAQMKRLEKSDEELKKEVSDLKIKIRELQQHVEELDRRLEG